MGFNELFVVIMWWQVVTGDAGWTGSVPRAAGSVPLCGFAMPGPASVGYFEVMLRLPHFPSIEAPLVN